MDNDWIENLRNISRQAEEAAKPCSVLLGTVTGTSPVAQMSIPGVGDVAVAVKNALKAGEAVILVQKRGAQQYLVIDRY